MVLVVSLLCFISDTLVVEIILVGTMRIRINIYSILISQMHSLS
jgi:hypothetical protein